MKYHGAETDVSLPAFINGTAVTDISVNTFGDKKLRSLYISENIQFIEKGFFKYNYISKEITASAKSDRYYSTDGVLYNRERTVLISCPKERKQVEILPITLKIADYAFYKCRRLENVVTLPMGGGKGGSDFNPKGKSDNEVMRFCQSFMTELCKHIGPNTDVPAGDIGVGAREIGFLFGQYKRIRNEFTGVLTGKNREFGGSRVRPEATGYGTVYFAQHMLAEKGEKIAGKTVAISGFGNVAWGAAQKLVQLGAKLVTISGPDGYIYDEKGLTQEGVDYMLELRASNNDVVAPYAEKFGAKFFPKAKPWEVKCDIAFPCAIQNELNEEDAKKLVANGCQMVVETSNMGCTAEAVNYLNEHITFAPGKAANAGGVAVSGLEMSQNSMRYSWTAEEVDAKLSQIMKDIHDTCVKFGREGNKINYVKGANIGGFIKVAEAMCAQGHC